jgi:hypothetical protein
MWGKKYVPPLMFLYDYATQNSTLKFLPKVSKILWHIVPLLGNDREINNRTTAVAK